MAKSILKQTLVLLFTGLFCYQLTQAAVYGKITGAIKDRATGDPLPAANVMLKGTALGAASNFKGEYEIVGVPPGEYILRISFIGYKTKEMTVRVAAGQNTKMNVEMDFDVVEGETVTITAQAEGQVAAINQQLRSNTITNVVSAERIMEFPDANAAESVGRLPGIAIRRSGGEGNKIIIRGLSPAFNTITVSGEKIPATDLDDRSVDIAMISPEILAGIEVIKALTPDKDADTFGGTVDFKLANAPHGGFKSRFRFQEGYNAQRNEPGQYKGNMTISKRYWDEKFGIMVTGSMENTQRGNDQFQANYRVVREKREGEVTAPISAEEVTLSHSYETRKRLGVSVLMDYELSFGRLLFSNFMSRLDRNELIRQNIYDGASNFHNYMLRKRDNQIDVLTHSLAGEFDLFFGTMDWRMSRTASLTRQPFEHRLEFRERSGFDMGGLPETYGPDILINAANNNLQNAGLYVGRFATQRSSERDLSTQFNLKVPVTLTKSIAGFVKLGGKMIHKSKERDQDNANHRLDNQNSDYEIYHTRYGDPDFVFQKLEDTGNASILNYLDPDFDPGDFLGGSFSFKAGLSNAEISHLLDSFLYNYYNLQIEDDVDDYRTIEKVYAGYIMSEMNFGKWLMVLPGVRYEGTFADMTGRKGSVGDEFFEGEMEDVIFLDTTATATYGKWFPMVHTRIRPVSWFDIRLAYTESISRPRLSWMIPKRNVSSGNQSVEFGRPDLKPQTSTNYDVFLSFYGNKIGLFTLGGFYKKIHDLIYEREGHRILDAEKEGFPKELQGLELIQPENNPFDTEVKGFEIEWQTNFHWLPRPFNGLVLNLNYAFIRSETQFPRSFVSQERIPVFPFVRTTVIDTFRVGPMPDQSNDIANVTIGYDIGRFSGRVSFLYQGRTLTNVGERPELDGFTKDLLRWDLSVKFRLTDHIGLFYNLNNFTNWPDESYQQETRFSTKKEVYGWTTDIGIGLNF